MGHEQLMKDHIAGDAQDAHESDVQQKLIDARRDRATTNREHQFAAFCEDQALPYIDEEAMDEVALVHGSASNIDWASAKEHSTMFEGWLAAWTLLVGGDLDAKPED